MAKLVLTVIGDDQSGLVDALSGVVADHEGNWDTSQMARLAGKFAGIVLISVPDQKVAGLLESLAPLKNQGLLDITASDANAESAEVGSTVLSLELLGPDHPGIIHDISHALATLGVSIEELSTETFSAPMAGGQLFRATAKLRVPSGLTLEDLYETIDKLADELLVDIELHE